MGYCRFRFFFFCLWAHVVTRPRPVSIWQVGQQQCHAAMPLVGTRRCKILVAASTCRALRRKRNTVTETHSTCDSHDHDVLCCVCVTVEGRVDVRFWGSMSATCSVLLPFLCREERLRHRRGQLRLCERCRCAAELTRHASTEWDSLSGHFHLRPPSACGSKKSQLRTMVVTQAPASRQTLPTLFFSSKPPAQSTTPPAHTLHDDGLMNPVDGHIGRCEQWEEELDGVCVAGGCGRGEMRSVLGNSTVWLLTVPHHPKQRVLPETAVHSRLVLSSGGGWPRTMEDVRSLCAATRDGGPSPTARHSRNAPATVSSV